MWQSALTGTTVTFGVLAVAAIALYATACLLVRKEH